MNSRSYIFASFLFIASFVFTHSAHASILGGSFNKPIISKDQSEAAVLMRDGIAELNDVVLIFGAALKESFNLIADDIYARYRLALEQQSVKNQSNFQTAQKYSMKSFVANGSLLSNEQISTAMHEVYAGSSFFESIRKFHSSVVLLTNFYNQPIIQARLHDGLEEINDRYSITMNKVGDVIAFTSDSLYSGYQSSETPKRAIATLASFVRIGSP